MLGDGGEARPLETEKRPKRPERTPVGGGGTRPRLPKQEKWVLFSGQVEAAVNGPRPPARAGGSVELPRIQPLLANGLGENGRQFSGWFSDPELLNK